ncbi:MAG: Gfo/Idh/MocA family oxidoreductase [Planctomycetaceae bacterium]|jgi:UDP-N-acetylglucosamine 3-dehydrogenase|nr:Gfo/Idh/MocA family oxidoreductase [Planctomycetaceae bacterium]
MVQPLNWSIIGLGRFGKIHAETLREITGVHLHSACSRNVQTLQSHASDLQLTNTTIDYQDILTDPAVDIVSIVTHWEDHFQVAIDALQAGKHVLLEKPMAATLEQCREIQECAQHSDGKFMVGHICRFDPRYALARESIMAGDIGTICSIHACRNLPTVAGNIRLDKISPMIGDGIHDLDLVMWMLGRRPLSVMAKNVRVHDFRYPDISWAMFDFSDPAMDHETIAVIETNWALPQNTPTVIDAQMEIVGTTGQIHINCSETGLQVQTLEETKYKDTMYWPQVNDQHRTGILKSELEYFAKCIHLNLPINIITAKEARQAMEIILLAEESAQRGQPLPIPPAE